MRACLGSGGEGEGGDLDALVELEGSFVLIPFQVIRGIGTI